MSRGDLVPAGLLLRLVLQAQGRSQAEAAFAMGVSEKHLSQVILGRSGMSADMATRIEAVVGVRAEIWLLAQAMDQLDQLDTEDDAPGT